MCPRFVDLAIFALVCDVDWMWFLVLRKRAAQDDSLEELGDTTLALVEQVDGFEDGIAYDFQALGA
jgi:hypothetical protein